jgi:multidrug efflux pump subunit AcrA (membrane-fusion protein)
MCFSAILFGVVYLAVAQQPAGMPGTVILSDCLVCLKGEADIPAQEGCVIKKILVKENDIVSLGAKLLQMEDDIPQQQVKVAEEELKAAVVQAENTIPERYAQKSWEVAIADLNISTKANEKVRDSVPQAVINKQILECKQMELSIDKALMDRKIAITQQEVSRAKLEAAKITLRHREIISPLKGEVREIKRHVGEWVQMGEPVIHVVQMDVLHVQGRADPSKVTPSKLLDRTVKIDIKLGDRIASVSGTITFVDPIIDHSGRYWVRAEITNREENGQYLFRPGMTATMTIDPK